MENTTVEEMIRKAKKNLNELSVNDVENILNSNICHEVKNIFVLDFVYE